MTVDKESPGDGLHAGTGIQDWNVKYCFCTSGRASYSIEVCFSPSIRVVARVGEHLKFEACMDVMDLLYENEETSILYSSPHALAASIVIVAYVVTVPLQRWEFPVLPWVKFVTSCKEEEILDSVRVILNHIFEPQAD